MSGAPALAFQDYNLNRGTLSAGEACWPGPAEMWDVERWKQFFLKEVVFWIIFLVITKLINDAMIQGLGGPSMSKINELMQHQSARI